MASQSASLVRAAAFLSNSFSLGLEPEQPNRCEEEWGEPASQGLEPGSGVIWSPECLGCWGDRYLWHSNTLRGDGAIPGRTGAAPVHGQRGAGGRPGWRDGSGDGDPCRAEHHRPRPGRTAPRAGRPRQSRPPPWRGTQAGGGDATRPAGGFGRAGAIGHPRRSRGRLAVGQQEPTPPRSRADRARLHRRPDAGRPTAAPARLQPAGQPQDPRGHKPPRPRRPIRIHQRAGEGLADRRPAGDLVRHEEERARDVKNGGRELRPKGQPEAVRVHDFALPELGKVAPYGVYDIAANAGWVNLGIDHDTAAFAVESLRHWWRDLGRPRYPTATRLLITADCGGSNGVRVRLWKRELQGFADETGLSVTVAHLPPGTSTWNRIEHRLFAFITQTWRGKPLLTHQVIVQLIASTTTRTGLTVRCRLDRSPYAKGVRVSDAERAPLNLRPAAFHGDWNYTIRPRQPTDRRSCSGSGPKDRVCSPLCDNARAVYRGLPRGRGWARSCSRPRFRHRLAQRGVTRRLRHTILWSQKLSPACRPAASHPEPQSPGGMRLGETRARAGGVAIIA